MTRPNVPGVDHPMGPLTVSTARAVSPPLTNVVPPRHSPRLASLNIKRQGIGELEGTSPINNNKNRQANNTRNKKSFHERTQEAILSSLNISQHQVSARTLSHWQYSKEVLATLLNKETGELMEYRHLIGNHRYRVLWIKSNGNKLGHLVQEMPGRVKGTYMIFFINKADIPADC